MKKKIYLIDISSLIFRAFYAVRPLTSPSGTPTNALFGVFSMVLKLLKDEKPEYIVFCFDRKEPSFRKEIYPEYKAHRTEMPEDLVPQMPYFRKIADALGITSLEVPGFEADDIIGTLTHIGLKNQMEVDIVSGDKDFGQLITDHVYLVDTMKNLKLDAKGVKEKWGVPPEQFIDFLALVGDTSDNIPGVTGVGPKGAQKLLEEFGTLENIYNNVDKISAKALKEKLIRDKEQAFLSQKLVTITTNIPLSEDMRTYKMQGLQWAILNPLLEELGFKNFDKTLQAIAGNSSISKADITNNDIQNSNSSSISSEAGIEINTTSKNSDSDSDSDSEKPVTDFAIHATKKSNFKSPEIHYQEVDEEGLNKIVSPLLEKNHFELWGLELNGGILLGFEKTGHLFRFLGAPETIGTWAVNLHPHHSATETIQWMGFDLKSFWHFIQFGHYKNIHQQAFCVQEKIQTMVPGITWDSLLAAYVIRPGDSTDYVRVYSKFMASLPAELPSPVEHFHNHLALKHELLEQVEYVHGMKVLKELDFPIAPILYSMERLGILLDVPALHQQSKELTTELAQIEKAIHEMAGEVFNIASPKQLGLVLFQKLNLPTSKKTKTGFSTDEDVLIKLKSVHPIAQLILDFREVAKLKSTYVDALPALVHEDGRIHSNFRQALTTTGRLSSSEPNLQNIPIRTDKGARIRKAFIAQPGQELLSADYSQIELRILAHYSKDAGLNEAFQNDIDIHTRTASEVFGVSLSEVTSEMRRTAKAVNFGIAYGQGAFGLAEALGISRSESSEIIKKYFTRFPGVKSYIEDTIALAKENGFVETLYGRRRYIDEIRSKNAAIQKFGERAAINAPMQGTASDIVKKAMIECFYKIPLNLILQIHDELIFEGAKEKIQHLKSKVISVMESVATLSVPLKVNANSGKNWDEAH